MPPRRLSEPTDLVTLVVDGDEVRARAGEPVAVALAAAGRLVLGRSVKYHRPRGATCFEGRCDGCLMRVDGQPNVMTCRVPAREGMVVETQNVLGSAENDLLAATDWFFPGGMDHHHMFTRFRPINELMQKVARRIAGIGRIPDEVIDKVASREVAIDVLVVGGGPAGLVAAEALARRGLGVHVVEDARDFGGHLAVHPGRLADEDGSERDAREIAARLAGAARGAGATLLADHAAVGVYEREVAVDSPSELVRYRPRALVVATGLHEGAVLVPGNDTPGVFSARGAARLLAHGVLPGARVLLAGEGEATGVLAEALARAGAEIEGPFDATALSLVHGRPSVQRVDVIENGKTRRVRCDAVVLAAQPSAVYEVAAQAGLDVEYRDGGFVVAPIAREGAARGPWLATAAGACTGARTLADVGRSARAAADRVTTALGTPGGAAHV
jgi:sarcosine oxidase subunit alpha